MTNLLTDTVPDLGKKVSLGGKLLGALFLLAVIPMNAIWKWGYSVSELVFAACFFAGLGLPVDFSKIVSKFIRPATPEVPPPEGV